MEETHSEVRQLLALTDSQERTSKLAALIKEMKEAPKAKEAQHRRCGVDLGGQVGCGFCFSVLFFFFLFWC